MSLTARRILLVCWFVVAVPILCLGQAPADAKKGANAPRSAEDKELSCWTVRYSQCDGVERSGDLVFVFPRAAWRRDPAKVVKKLQAGWDLLRKATDIDPVKTFGQRVVVGFRHPKDEGGKDCVPGWWMESGGKHGFPRERWPFINIPWGYLSGKDQPEECLTHEFVHAFIEARPLRDNRKDWVEGMCDFLRLPVFGAFDMARARDERYRQYRSSAWKPGANSYHDYAGRLIYWSEKRGLDVRKPEHLAKIVPALWDMDLTEALGQRPK
jgi:hypothetical protein